MEFRSNLLHMYKPIIIIANYFVKSRNQLNLGVWIGLRWNTSLPWCTFSWIDGSTNQGDLGNSNLCADRGCAKISGYYFEMVTSYCTFEKYFLCETIGKIDLYFKFYLLPV